jgi:hypothetical protein
VINCRRTGEHRDIKTPLIVIVAVPVHGAQEVFPLVDR